MRQPQENEPFLDRVLLLFLFALFLLLSPLVHWWAADTSPWYSPFLVWGLLIALTFAVERLRARHDV